MTQTVAEPPCASAPPHPYMTIRQAIDIYTSYGDELEEFYVNVYRNLIRNKPRVELSNSNYLHALQLTSLMMRNTHQSFMMLSGGTTDCFVGILLNEFRKMLTRLSESNQRAQVVVLDAVDGCPNLRKLQDEFPDTFQVFFGVTKLDSSIGHFIVADDMVRVEKPHPLLNEASDANNIEASVIFNSNADSMRYRGVFGHFLRMVAPHSS